jgi:hypothetical protein
MILAGEAPATPDGLDALMPAWAQQLSLLGLLILILAAWLTGRVITKAQNERDVAAERRIADIWKTNYEDSLALNKQLTEGFQPVLDQNAAIFKIVEALQNRQLELERREERERWLRDQGDRDR